MQKKIKVSHENSIQGKTVREENNEHMVFISQFEFIDYFSLLYLNHKFLDN